MRDDQGMAHIFTADDLEEWREHGLDPAEAPMWFAVLVDRLGEPSAGLWPLLKTESPNMFAISYALNWKYDFGETYAGAEPWLADFPVLNGAEEAKPWRNAGWGGTSAQGRTPANAAAFAEAGLGPGDAERWSNAGIAISDAVRFIGAGVSLDEALTGPWDDEQLKMMKGLRDAGLSGG